MGGYHMLWQSVLGAIGGFLYEICKEEYDKEEIDKYKDKIKEKYKEICNFSVPPKAESIKDLNEYQIRQILLTPKVKNIVDDIIKTQTGIVNAFDPEEYYRHKEIIKQNNFTINFDALKSNPDKFIDSEDSQILQKYRKEWFKEKDKNKSYTLTIEND
jgi:hypothetical protein